MKAVAGTGLRTGAGTETEMNKDDTSEMLISALQQIARGHQCKRPLPAALAQRIAKSALRQADLDWVGRGHFQWVESDGDHWLKPVERN
jgi:hypothetical protein